MRRIAGVLLLAGLAVACGGDDGTEEGAGATTRPTVVTTTTGVPGALPDAVDLDDTGALAIEAEPFADWVTIAGDFAWVANVEDGVARYDLATGELIGSSPTGSEICLAMEQGFDSVWAGNCGSPQLFRIDAATGDIAATIELPVNVLLVESSIGVDQSGVWALAAADAGYLLLHVDPATNTVVDTFPAPEVATGVRAGEGSVWVTSATQGLLHQVDPETGRVRRSIDVADGSTFLAVGEGSVWTLGSDHAEVTRIHPTTGEVVATIPVGLGAVEGGDIAVGGGYVWARVSDALVAQIDPDTDRVVARYGERSGSGSVAADDDAVWISAHDVNTIWRLPYG